MREAKATMLTNETEAIKVKKERDGIKSGGHFDLIVIGAGPGGMAAAAGAYDRGLKKILVADRNSYPGGILPQCIHEGFGRNQAGRPLTGPECAAFWKRNLDQRGVPVLPSTTILEIGYGSRPYRLRYLSERIGAGTFTADGVILAMGCRERTLGQMRIPGSRPAGIYTAGTAQYMMNRQNLLPGKRAVILGSGDIGLIMARRLILEGLTVRLILGEKASGLARNHIQCVQDFGIPIRFGWTLLSTHGYRRLTGVSVAPLGLDGKPDLSRKEYIRCDTLLVAAGLIPETELFTTSGTSLTEAFGIPAGPSGATPLPGVFACGNVTRIYDLVEEVTRDGQAAGKAAADFLLAERQGKLSGAPRDGVSVGDTDGAGAVSDAEYTDCDGACTYAGAGRGPGESGTAAPREPGYEALENLGPDEMVCILCPRGCRISRAHPEKGGKCPKGKDYAIAELEDPRRTLTTTVRLEGTGTAVWPDRLLPVRSREPLPKDLWSEAMKQIRRLSVKGPVGEGQILLDSICDTGIPLVASASFEISGEGRDL